MIRTNFQTCFHLIFSRNQNFNFFRSIRSIAWRDETSPKLIKGKVKTTTIYDDKARIGSYEDFVEDFKKSNLGDHLELEKSFVEEDAYGHAFERCEQYNDMHLSEEKAHKFFIKKEIIKKKYFKLDKETNLLTHAAKEQIRHLHKTNPLEWNCKALAECFPISEAGVKKLLKSNFVQTSEKIKAHDEEVAKRWKSLKSGEFTTYITPLTQKLYEEGKLVDDYFSGNPNLPTIPPSQKVIQIKRKKFIGEFSEIVKTYVNYENQKLLESGKENTTENQLSLTENNGTELSRKLSKKLLKNVKKAHVEFDDESYVTLKSPVRRKQSFENTDLPLSQFKEILKEETKVKSKNQIDYGELLSEQTSNSDDSSKKLHATQNCFLKIDKYDSNRNINVMYEKNKDLKNVYKYDEKLGYQHPVGKYFKGNIYIPPQMHKKGKLYKVGQCVYDDNGEFLYKVP